jgi:hypothetical protein
MLKRGLKFSVWTAVSGLLVVSLVFASATVAANSESPSSGADKKSKLVDLWQPGDSGQRMNIRGPGRYAAARHQYRDSAAGR